MGRVKLEIKKIVNPANLKVTYSKRKNGLLKKAYELSVLSDVDIAVIMFSPSGKLTQYCREDRIEEVITRFANTRQHDRPKRKFEDVEFLNNVVQKLNDERALEAPRVDAADLQAQVQVVRMRTLLNNAVLERNLCEQKARLLADDQINSFCLERLLIVQSELVLALTPVQERMRWLGCFPARESIEGLNVGSAPDSAQAMNMHNWDGVHLDNATSVMANSQMRESPGADYEGNNSFYARPSNMEQYHVRASPIGQDGEFNHFHDTRMVVTAGPGGQSTEFNSYSTKFEENPSQFAYASGGGQPQISSLPNQGRQGQLRNGDTDYPLYGAPLRHPSQHASTSWNHHQPWMP